MAVPTVPSSPPKTSAPDTAAPARRNADTQEAATIHAAGFSQMLLAAENEPAADALLALGNGLALTEIPLALTPSEDDLNPAAGEQVLDLSLMLGQQGFRMESLVQQTAQKDLQGDIGLRDGSFLQAKRDAGQALLPGGAAVAQWVQEAASTAVPVVAQGVSCMAAGVGVSQAGSMLLQSLAQPAENAVQQLQAALVGDGEVEVLESGMLEKTAMAAPVAASAESRAAAPTEAMQRIMAQMSQFLSSTGALDTAGLRRRGMTGVEAGTTGNEAPAHGWMQAGSQTLLTDFAVQQAGEAQQAGNEPAAAEPEAEMSFWMQARQQRAELVLDRDGSPVRVQVMLEGNTAHITFRSDEAATRAQLDEGLAQLRDMLTAQGMEVAEVQVRAGNDGMADGSSERNDQPFMPEGASKVLVQAASVESRPEASTLTRSQRVQGIDVFA